MIRILDDHVINQIAAGEVVERPASAVKELVENALDAGANSIDVTLKGGGRDLIRVEDDGCGMSRQDALLCIERHATSKIRDTNDLFSVNTLGFRGEALPSIASVSKFSIVTRRAEDEVGTKLVIDGGKLISVDPIGCPVGTRIEVRNLFGNLPARRKFLRSEATELAHCMEAVHRQALLRDGVSFRVLHDDRELWRVTPMGGRPARVRAVLGEAGRALVPVSFESGEVAVEGWVAPPGVHVAESTGSTYLFVNGRFVRDPVVRRAISAAYKGVLPQGRHPVLVLEIRVAPDRLDVNVHPAKTEVRFRDPWAVVEAVSEGLRRALQGKMAPKERITNEDSAFVQRVARPTGPGPLFSGVAPREELSSPMMEPPRLDPSPPAAPPRPSAGKKASVSAHPDDDPSFRPAPEWMPPEPISLHVVPEVLTVNEPKTPARIWRELRPLGVIGSQLHAEHRGDWVVVDTLAAAGRLLDSDARKGRVRSQRLLVPSTGVVAPTALAKINENRDSLLKYGLDVDSSHGSAVLLAVPEEAEIPAEALSSLGLALERGRSLGEFLAPFLPALSAEDPLEWRLLLARLEEQEIPEVGLVGRWTPDEIARRIRKGG